jgi:hypothetical protein
MAIELTGMLEVVKAEAAQYMDWFTSSLRSPAYIARRARTASGTEAADGGPLYVTLVLSAFIGATLGSLIPNRPALPQRAAVAVLVVAVWYFVALMLHSILRLLRCEVSVGTTTRTAMQLLALAYVAGNFIGLLIASAAGLVPHLQTLLESLRWGPGSPIVVAQFVMILVYLPLAFKSAFGFRGILAGTVGAVISFGISSTLVAQNSC